MKPTKKTQEAVRMLDTTSSGDPEMAHVYADDILLALVPTEVAEAYRRLQDRCSWWACA